MTAKWQYKQAYEAMAEEAQALKAENAKLRDAVDYLYGFARTLGVDESDMREFGIEVPDEYS
jgi:cell division protein FtsB